MATLFCSFLNPLFSVKMATKQGKQRMKEERSRKTKVKKTVYSDVDSDEDLEDNTAKDEG